MALIHDRELLDALEKLGGGPVSVEVWRVAWKSKDVLDVGGAGRWNPPGPFAAIYTSLTRDGAIAEIYHHLSRAPVFSSAEKQLHSLSVETRSTLRLDNEDALERPGLTARSLGENLSRTQEIGAAAHLLEYDSLLVPSLRWDCKNLVLFADHFSSDMIRRGEARDINWPAWREENEQEFANLRRKRAGRESR